ncbi:hypothetical protein B0H14DRAFT_2835585 [Mycena olivaceomarginata]|nr:hypothetical protein B0H14DRAFT_2835585 [Mycena olivaceomarginata]
MRRLRVGLQCAGRVILCVCIPFKFLTADGALLGPGSDRYQGRIPIPMLIKPTVPKLNIFVRVIRTRSTRRTDNLKERGSAAAIT